jgi:hypothetical protein
MKLHLNMAHGRQSTVYNAPCVFLISAVSLSAIAVSVRAIRAHVRPVSFVGIPYISVAGEFDREAPDGGPDSEYSRQRDSEN